MGPGFQKKNTKAKAPLKIEAILEDPDENDAQLDGRSPPRPEKGKDKLDQDPTLNPQSSLIGDGTVD